MYEAPVNLWVKLNIQNDEHWLCEEVENSCSKVFCKKRVLKNLQNWLRACNFIKKDTPAQVFLCEFCEIFKNGLCYRTSPMAASVPL